MEGYGGLQMATATVTASAVRLVDVEPELARFLTPEQLSEASRVRVPVYEAAKGELELGSVLRERNGFGAIVLDGILLHVLRLGDQVVLRLLGPGDLVSPTGMLDSIVLDQSELRATTPTRLAVLGNEVLLATHRWPRIVAALHVRVAEQVERLATQLAICQLPRVDQRLLALMWLLAESWGQVTPSGTTLPLTLTHDTLGRLIGARRPTVTLALGELSERGAIVRQDRGWLLLEPLPRPSGPMPKLEEPEPVYATTSGWVQGAETLEMSAADRDELRHAVARLRADHARTTQLFRARQQEWADARERASQSRRRVGPDARPPRPAPS